MTMAAASEEKKFGKAMKEEGEASRKMT